MIFVICYVFSSFLFLCSVGNLFTFWFFPIIYFYLYLDKCVAAIDSLIRCSKIILSLNNAFLSIVDPCSLY